MNEPYDFRNDDGWRMTIAKVRRRQGTIIYMRFIRNAYHSMASLGRRCLCRAKLSKVEVNKLSFAELTTYIMVVRARAHATVAQISDAQENWQTNWLVFAVWMDEMEWSRFVTWWCQGAERRSKEHMAYGRLTKTIPGGRANGKMLRMILEMENQKESRCFYWFRTEEPIHTEGVR